MPDLVQVFFTIINIFPRKHLFNSDEQKLIMIFKKLTKFKVLQT